MIGLAAADADAGVPCPRCGSTRLVCFCVAPPQWHTWADDDDIEHAANTGQADPSKSICGCYCALKADEETT